MPQYIPVNKESLMKKSQRIEITIQGDDYIFEFYYNPKEEIFTFDLYKNNEPIIYGRKIVYAQNIVEDIVCCFEIIPVSPDRNIRSVTKENFLDSVKLYLVED